MKNNLNELIINTCERRGIDWTSFLASYYGYRNKEEYNSSILSENKRLKEELEELKRENRTLRKKLSTYRKNVQYFERKFSYEDYIYV